MELFVKKLFEKWRRDFGSGCSACKSGFIASKTLFFQTAGHFRSLGFDFSNSF